MTDDARYEGMEPLPRGSHAIEIVTPKGTFDLHNGGYVESIALEPPDTLSVTVRCTYFAPDRVRVRLRFTGVRGFSSSQYEENPREASTWEHLVDWGGRFELRTGTHDLEFEAAAVSASTEPVTGTAIDPAGFRAAVAAELAPVLRRHGFEAVGREEYSVRFERQSVFVEVSYDARRSWEVDVWLARGEGGTASIDLAQALEAIGCPRMGITASQTGEPQVLRKLLARAAEALDGCGAALLDEDGAALDRAFQRREEEAAAYERSYVPMRLLEEAEAAWAAKDLPRLVELLDPVRDRLEPRHARRLAFAEKRSALG